MRIIVENKLFDQIKGPPGQHGATRPVHQRTLQNPQLQVSFAMRDWRLGDVIGGAELKSVRSNTSFNVGWLRLLVLIFARASRC